MVRIVRVLFVVAALMLSVSCKKNTTEPGGTVTISGQITDVVSGAAIASVTVAVQGKTATTGSDGMYTIADLNTGSTTITAQHQGHVNYSQAVTLAGATQTVSFPMTRSKAAATAGNWTGPWTNFTFGSSGSMTMAISVDTIAQTLQLNLDLNGNVFGKGDPASESFTGSYTESGGTTLTKTSAFYGTITITVSGTGQITGTITNVPGGTITRVDFNGNVTETVLTINYTVTFPTGGPATGNIGATRIS